MKLLENLIGAINPQEACAREAWRQQLEELKRDYDAGSYRRVNSGWTATNQSAELTDCPHRDTIRARARDLERNSDIANAILLAYKRNVIGAGFVLQARTGDAELNDAIENAWQEWTRKQNCDVTGTQCFTHMLRMAIERKKVDGGILFLKRFTGAELMPFQLQALEVDELDITQMQPRNKGNKVVGGVEYNEFHKPIGYFIRQYDLEGYQLMEPIYLPAKEVIFYFSKRRPSQVREMSDLAPTVERVRDINEFMNAVAVKERIAACLAVFVKRQTPALGRGRTGGTERSVDYTGKRITPGMIKELNAGDEIQVVDPKAQATDATGYIKLQQRLMGAGQGISYEAVSRDMSETNYSSARQGSIEDEMTYAEESELLRETLMDEVYETFLLCGYLTGLFSMPDFWNRRREYTRHEWVASPKKWIDPMKEARSNQIALQTGQKTFQQIAAENGRDWKTQIDEMSDAIAYGNEKGIDLGGVIFGKTSRPLLETATGAAASKGKPTGEAE